MKKLYVIVLMFCSFLFFVGCDGVGNEVEKVSKGLSNYYMNIEYDDVNKTLNVTQTF